MSSITSTTRSTEGRAFWRETRVQRVLAGKWGLEARGSQLPDERPERGFLAGTEILQLAATGFAWQVRGETFKVTRSYTA